MLFQAESSGFFFLPSRCSGTHANNQVATILLVALHEEKKLEILTFRSLRSYGNVAAAAGCLKGWNYTFSAHTCFHFINREKRQKKTHFWVDDKNPFARQNSKLMAFETFQLLKFFSAQLKIGFSGVA